jgi:CubicO group peptidase (beta-lactamase class C family)
MVFGAFCICAAVFAFTGAVSAPSNAGARPTAKAMQGDAPSPDIEIVRYEDNTAHGAGTKIHPAAKITVRLVNHASVASRPVSLVLNEAHGLWKQAGAPVAVGALKAGEASKLIILNFTPNDHVMNFKLTDWAKAFQRACEFEFSAILSETHVFGPVHVNPGDPVERLALKRRIFVDRTGAVVNRNLQVGRQVNYLPQLAPPQICDDSICVSLNDVADSIHSQLACHVVGYAFFVGNTTSGYKGVFGAYGKARTNANPPAANFTQTTKMQIASTSKVLTALMGIRELGSTINNPAYTYFPSSWHVPQDSIVRNITFRQFLSQTSGVQQYYAGDLGQTYDNLKAFFTQTLSNPGAPRSCPGPKAPMPIANPIVTDIAPCYANTNFGLMRIAIPRMAGDTSSDNDTLSDKYVDLVKQDVFAPVGVTNVACKPPGDGKYALLYKYPGTQPGEDFGDLTSVCGDWGWYVSVEDYAKVLVSINAQDGKVLRNCELHDMVTNPSSHAVGWDRKTDGAGHRWLEKNGADGRGSALQTTSVGIYGGRDGCVVRGRGVPPVPGVAAVLFINSDVGTAAAPIADSVLLTALHAGTAPKT